MKKKTIGISIIISIFLIGIVSAGLVSYLSNIVTGSVEVKGPVFYLDGHLGGAYYNLFINEIPLEKEIYFYDGNRILFITEPLDVNGFYKAKFDIHIWAKTNNLGNIIQFQIVRIKPELEEEIICIPPSVSITPEYSERITTCSSIDSIILNPEDKIGIIISGAGLDSEYWVRTGKIDTNDYSRIEVSAI